MNFAVAYLVSIQCNCGDRYRGDKNARRLQCPNHFAYKSVFTERPVFRKNLHQRQGHRNEAEQQI